MSASTLRKAVAGVALLTGSVLGMASVASATTITKVPKMSRTQLASACSKTGGNSYGNKNAWGCTTSSGSDTTECTKAGCKSYHWDPMRVAPIRNVIVAGPVAGIALR